MTALAFRKPYRMKRKKSIFKNRFFWLGIFILFTIGIITYLVIFSPVFQVKEIKIAGNEKVPKEDLEDFIWENIDKKILIFPTKSIFLANLQEIEKNLLEKFPKISQANLKRQFPDILILGIQERQPLFIFCKDPELCFYLDEGGVIFDPVQNNISNEVEEISEMEPFLKIKDVRSQEMNLGEKIITDDLLGGIKEIILELRGNLGISPKELTLFEERVEIQTTQGFGIYFNSKEDILNQLQNLNLVLEKEIPPESRENLEYIDLRFGNKVYYKYK